MLALKKETAVTTKSQSSRYFESTQETLVGLYSKRDSKTGKPVETVNEIVHRVASAVALAELKYILRPDEIVAMSLEQALSNGRVAQWKKEFAESIGKQKFWANTPANINADPDTSLKVLKYWAYGQLANLKEDEIWLRAEEFRIAYESKSSKPSTLSEQQLAMGRIVSELRGKGCLAAWRAFRTQRAPSLWLPKRRWEWD
jgi:hypothetical protein